MGRLRHLKTGDPKGGAKESVNLPALRALYLMLVIHGTTDTGQTLDESDIGRIRITRFGDEIQGETFEYFFDKSNLLGGYPHKTAPAAAASRITAFIPFFMKGLRNAIDAADDQEVKIFVDFDSVLDTRFGANAATYELYARTAPTVPERYELRVEEQDVVSTGGGRYNPQLSGKNQGVIYFRDAGSVVDSINLQIDDEVAVDTIDDDALLDMTTFENQLESAAGGLIEVHNAPGGSIAETQNEKVELSVQFSAAGTLEVTKERVVRSERAEQSIANVRARLRSQVAGSLGRPEARSRGARG